MDTFIYGKPFKLTGLLISLYELILIRAVYIHVCKLTVVVVVVVVNIITQATSRGDILKQIVTAS